MSRIRLILAWLVMAAVPLQGFAAATMLFCADMPAVIASDVHEHGKDHSDSSIGAVHHSHPDHAHEAMGGQHNSVHGDANKQASDVSHKCGVCASCCHIVAINEVSAEMEVAPSAKADLIEPFVQVHSRPTPVPDKPPRV